MNAAFVFKFTVNALAAYRKHDFFDSAEFGVVFVDKFGFPTIFFGEFKVHSVQFVGKQSRLFAARSAADFHNYVFIVVGVFGQKQNFKFVGEFG